MKTKLLTLLLMLSLGLTGCSLARPEKTDTGLQSGDRFLGVYMVFRGDYDSWNFHDNPYLEELGTEEIDTGKYGTLPFPREVLFGEIHRAEHTVTFPGLEGYALFAYSWTDEDGAPCSTSFSDMGGGGFHVIHSDEGTRHELEGTLYVLPNTSENTVQHGVWTALRVFQTSDGRIYVDGSGNSYSGGGFSTITQEATYTETVNGESTSNSVQVTVHMEEAAPLEKLVLIQFGENSTILRTEEVSIPEEGLDYYTLENAEWVLIEEHRSTGVERTVVTPQRGEDAKAEYHGVVQFNEEGRGFDTQLRIW